MIRSRAAWLNGAPQIAPTRLGRVQCTTSTSGWCRRRISAACSDTGGPALFLLGCTLFMRISDERRTPPLSHTASRHLARAARVAMTPCDAPRAESSLRRVFFIFG